MYIELQTFFNSYNVAAFQPLHFKEREMLHIDQKDTLEVS